jgi:hypothetical protein
MSEPQSRRQAFREKRAEPEKLDPTPIEIPVDARTPGNSVAEQIQQEIARQLAKKQYGPQEMGAAEILQELQELEVDDLPDELPVFSQYEYENMPDELIPGVDLDEEEAAVLAGQEGDSENHPPGSPSDAPPDSSLPNTEPPPAA